MKPPRPFRPTGARPAPVRISPADLVRTSGDFPRVIEPAEALDPPAWAASAAPWLREQLLIHGALLLRGFAITSAEELRAVAAAIAPDLLDYAERAAPRSRVTANVFTSTELNAAHRIGLHHEMSYSHQWPSKVFFWCEQPAPEGGCTPLVDDRRVIGRIAPAIRRRFEAGGVMYVRNYCPEIDPWQEVFQTRDRAEVERYCRDSGTELEWRDGDRLRTRQVRQVVATHPVTGDTVWFNHAHLFHVSSVEEDLRDSLLAAVAPDELPRNAFYGDGGAIEPSVLDEIRGIYDAAAVRFPWRAGDLLIVDNILCSHGRDPYAGPRRVLVAMAELYRPMR